jgi:hypothetical protein
VPGLNVASGVASSAIGGKGNTASGDFSHATGYNSQAQSLASVAVGSLNQGGGTDDEWVDTDPLFEVGNGWSETSPMSGDRSNALTTLKNGRTTLTNKFWDSGEPTDVPVASGSSDGTALVVEGHTKLK